MGETGYCVKCKMKREIANAKEVSMKGKGGVTRRALKGSCPKCSTTMFRIMGGTAKAGAAKKKK